MDEPNLRFLVLGQLGRIADCGRLTAHSGARIVGATHAWPQGSGMPDPYARRRHRYLTPSKGMSSGVGASSRQRHEG